jgi:hypothetical protein
MSYSQGAEDTREDVNYAGFLYHIVPELAFAKNLEEDALMGRLSRHHMPSPVLKREISYKRSMSGSSPPQSIKKQAQATAASESCKSLREEEKEGCIDDVVPTGEVHMHHIIEVVHGVNLAIDIDLPLKNQAALKIQSKFRCRIAKRQMHHLKQVRQL